MSVIIESVSVKGPSKTIKSHHNVGGLPDWMKFKLIEPLREIFKDEVRKLGIELGLPKYMVKRHPFPGPGLAIRVMGEVTEDALRLLRESDNIIAGGSLKGRWVIIGPKRLVGAKANFTRLFSFQLGFKVPGVEKVGIGVGIKPGELLIWNLTT